MYTKDTARHVVDACGEHNSLDAWRQLTECAHMNRLMRKALWPREAVAAKELEAAVAQWELDIQRWESASWETVSLAH